MTRHAYCMYLNLCTCKPHTRRLIQRSCIAHDAYNGQRRRNEYNFHHLWTWHAHRRPGGTQENTSLYIALHPVVNGKKVPDRPKKALPAISAAIIQAKKLAKGLPILIGGKSFGGRMCSQLAASEHLTDVKGIIYFGFPLHAIGKPSIDRAAHLSEVPQPQLFLQGTRDTLAEINLIKKVCKKLKKAKLEIFEGGDHSFKMLKSTGILQEEVIEKLAKTTADFFNG